MGTSTRWEGPKGGGWGAASGQLTKWQPDQRGADQRLEKIAANHLRALHQTLRADQSAFGLYSAACAAGERLAEAMGSLAAEGAESVDSLVARLVVEVGGDGGTVTDAAVRRAVATAVRDVQELHPELDEVMGTGSAGGGFAWDILCDLYQLFFADLVAEFLRSVVTEHVRLAVPVLIAVDPEGRIADWIAQKLVDLVPSPCAESIETTDQAEDASQSEVDAVPDPANTLPTLAKLLVPGAAGQVLGLITKEITGEEGTAA